MATAAKKPQTVDFFLILFFLSFWWKYWSWPVLLLFNSLLNVTWLNARRGTSFRLNRHRPGWAFISFVFIDFLVFLALRIFYAFFKKSLPSFTEFCCAVVLQRTMISVSFFSKCSLSRRELHFLLGQHGIAENQRLDESNEDWSTVTSLPHQSQWGASLGSHLIYFAMVRRTSGWSSCTELYRVLPIEATWFGSRAATFTEFLPSFTDGYRMVPLSLLLLRFFFELFFFFFFFPPFYLLPPDRRVNYSRRNEKKIEEKKRKTRERERETKVISLESTLWIGWRRPPLFLSFFVFFFGFSSFSFCSSRSVSLRSISFDFSGFLAGFLSFFCFVRRYVCALRSSFVCTRPFRAVRFVN